MRLEHPWESGHRVAMSGISSQQKFWKAMALYGCCAYVIPFLYWPLWKIGELIAFGSIIFACAIVGALLDVRHFESSRFGALIGGFWGSQLGLLYHLILSYTTLEYYEDLNLGFHGTFILLSPIAAIVGLGCGGGVWLSARIIRARGKDIRSS